MLPLGAHRGARRTTLVLLQVIVFVTYIFGPTSTFAEDPTPEPTPTGSSAPEPTDPPAPSAEPEPSIAPEPTFAPEPDPTAQPDPSATPDEPDPTVEPTAAPEPNTSPYVITYVPGTSDARQLEILADAAATDVSAIPQLTMRSILLSEKSYGDQLATLRANAEVDRVDLDRTREVGAEPSDPAFTEQWALGQVGWTDLYGTVSIGGSSTVAVLDTGVDALHPDLDGVVLPGFSVLDGGDGRMDPNGHGTWMAGIVAAETDNGLGVAGTAYAGVSILPVTVLDADGLGQDSDIITGVVYAADAGADVILMSFSNPGYSSALQAAIDYAWASGAVLVAAAGNDGSTTNSFPAGDRGVIGVASTDASDALTASSNSGAAVFLAAPGDGIATTSLGGGVSSISGTSASAAIVAGAAALLRANEPALSNGVVVNRLAATADPLSGSPVGNGRLNLLRAMADASLDAIQPAGSAPLGDGGPIVGPYVAAATNFQDLTIGVQSPASVIAGNAATYAVTVRFAGNGTCTVSSFAVTTSLPAGVTASFSPTSRTGTSTGNQNVTLTLSTTAGTPAGTTIFTVGATGTAGDCNTSRVASGTLVVQAPANSAPVLAAIGDKSVDELAALSFTATASDSDVPAQTLTFSLSNGTSGLVPSGASITTGGAFSWTPTEAQGSGSYTFDVCVSDGTASDCETITVTVAEVNVAPVLAAIGNQSVDELAALSFTASASDSDVPANTLTFSLVGAPAGATINASTGAFSWIPTEAQGPGSYPITVKVTDNGSPNLSDEELITVTVAEVNVAPTADAQSVTTDEDNALLITLTASDPDLPENPLTFAIITLPGDGGLYEGNSTATEDRIWSVPFALAGATVTYVPAIDFNGADAIVFVVNDGQVDSAPATVTITVNAVNDAPTCADDSDTTDEDVTLNGSVVCQDVDDAPEDLTYAVVDDVANGSLLLNADGTFSYNPNPDFNGTDSFTFTASDGELTSAPPALFTITVNAVNDAPLNSVPGPQATAEDTALVFSAGDGNLISTSDVDAGSNVVRVALTAANGNITLSGFTGLAFSDGDGTADASMTFDGTLADINSALAGLTFTPTDDFNGAASLAITTNDLGFTGAGGFQTDTDLVDITVTEVNDAPVAEDDSDSVAEDGSVNLDPRDNDSRGPANEATQTLTVTVLGTPANGTADIELDGTVTYTPNADFNGTDSFTYTVCDDGTTNGVPAVLCDDGLVTITVTEVNDAPSFTTGPDQTVLEDAGSQTVAGWATDISAGPADEASQVLTFSVTANTNSGLFSVQPAVDPLTGDLTYTPAANANGVATITLELSDDGGTADGGDDTSDAQTFDITVTPVNDAPTINPIADQLMLSNATRHIAVSGITSGPPNESDQTLTVTASSSDPSVVNVAVTYPDMGPSMAKLTLTTGAATCGSATITVTVQDNGGTVNGGVDATTTTFDVSTFHGRFLSPLKEGSVNMVQKGQVVPVQITFGCPGNISGLSPEIQLMTGTVGGADDESGLNAVQTESVSNADTGNIMRSVDNKYMYNLRIPNEKTWPKGQKLTIRVRPLGALGPSMYITLEIRK